MEGKAVAIGALAPALGDNVKLAKQMSQHSDHEKEVIKQDRIKKHEKRKAVDPSIVKAAKSTRTGTHTLRAQNAKRSEKDTDEEDSRLGTRDEYEKESGICEDDSLSQLRSFIERQFMLLECLCDSTHHMHHLHTNKLKLTNA